MSRQVIIMNGFPRSGKTTASEIIATKSNTLIYSSVNIVKEFAHKYFDWNGEKTPESRKFLSDLKRFLVEKTNLIEEDLTEVYELFQNSHFQYLIIDIREKDEIEKYKVLFNAITTFVERPQETLVLSNDSDKKVRDADYDYIINNNGALADLEDEIEYFLQEINVRELTL